LLDEFAFGADQGDGPAAAVVGVVVAFVVG
jgi:hypothetical protein